MTQPTDRDAFDRTQDTAVAQLEQQEAALAAKVDKLQHPTFITRDSAMRISRFTASSDATAADTLTGTAGHDKQHRHGTGRRFGACRPVWRLDRGADGLLRQVPVNACAKSLGGANEVLPEPAPVVTPSAPRKSFVERFLSSRNGG